MAPQNYREIDELLRARRSIDPSDRDLANAVQRGLEKSAPFTSDKNGVADALLIGIYGTQASARHATPSRTAFSADRRPRSETCRYQAIVQFALGLVLLPRG